jgi:beta-galactosidase
MITQVMGYNYIVQGDIDVHHAKFPWQAGIGTEETNTKQTRGIYFTDDRKAHMEPTNRMPENVGTESGWQFYATRPFLAGLFYWTGFDYRGESNPYNWPAVINQSGCIDLCGFPKDIFYYLKSWWGKEPVLHISPHWNWKKHEGQEINVTIYSNCDEVELFLNNKSLGKQTMIVNCHLEWKVNYRPSILMARGYKSGKEILRKEVTMSGEPAAIQFSTDRKSIQADGEDVSIINVQILDARGLIMPIAENEINFTLNGPGKIIGVGNGDPSSHEADRFFETMKTSKIENLKELVVNDLIDRPEVAVGFDNSAWKPALQSQRSDDWRVYTDSLIVIRGTFELSSFTNETEVNLFTKSIVENQSIYVNGHLLASNIKRDAPNQSFRIDHNRIKPGTNEYAVTGKRFRKRHQWDEPNTDPGLVQVVNPAGQWKRKVFNGMAQIIVQSTKQPGEITLSAVSSGLKHAVIKVQTHPVTVRRVVPTQ